VRDEYEKEMRDAEVSESTIKIFMKRYDKKQKITERLKKEGKYEETFEDYLKNNKRRANMEDYLMERTNQEVFHLERMVPKLSWRSKFNRRALMAYGHEQLEEAKETIKEMDDLKKGNIDRQIKEIMDDIAEKKKRKKEAKERILKGEHTKEDFYAMAEDIPDTTEKELREIAGRPSLIMTKHGEKELWYDEDTPPVDHEYISEDEAEREKYFPQLRQKHKMYTPEEAIDYLKEDISDTEMPAFKKLHMAAKMTVPGKGKRVPREDITKPKLNKV